MSDPERNSEGNYQTKVQNFILFKDLLSGVLQEACCEEQGSTGRVDLWRQFP